MQCQDEVLTFDLIQGQATPQTARKHLSPHWAPAGVFLSLTEMED